MKRPWKYNLTKEQDEMLIKAYKEKSHPVQFLLSLPLFENITETPIRRRSKELGVGRTKGSINKYKFTEEDNKLIISAYNKKKYPVPFLIKTYSQFNNLSKAIIWSQAVRLGLNKKKKKWNDEEKQILDKYLCDKPIKTIVDILRRKGYHRTEKAIRNYASRIHHYTKPDLFTMNTICMGVGVGRNKVRRWIKSGILKATFIKESNVHYIKPIDFTRFVLNYSDEIDTSRIYLPWIIALIKEFYIEVSRNRSKKSEMD
jgi:hypothetical protein